MANDCDIDIEKATVFMQELGNLAEKVDTDVLMALIYGAYGILLFLVLKAVLVYFRDSSDKKLVRDSYITMGKINAVLEQMNNSIQQLRCRGR